MKTFEEKYIEARREVIARDFSSLNDRQREAVMATEGPLLILAGAGSGKTTVLVNRIVNLMKYGRASDCDELPFWADEASLGVMEAYLAGDETKKQAAEEAAALDPVEPWQILAITFTNKAAGEMRDRLSRMLEGIQEKEREELREKLREELWARTFHSACVRILRRDADKLGWSNNFVIYDTTDRIAVMKRILKEQNLDEKKFPPKQMLSYMDTARDKLQTPAMMAEEAEKSGDWRMKTVAELYRAYLKRLFDDGAMDFEDLIYNTVKLFKTHPDVLEHYRRRFRYILIDEYQDTNNLQYQLAALLAGGRENICVVGDDDQSIYAFRGATIENILSFEDEYDNTRVIRLEQNYRSTGYILDAANGVVNHNTGRKGKKLWTKAGDGDRVTLYVARNEDDEAEYVVRQVLRAVQQGDNLRDHGVLYRTNAQSRALEQAFLRNGIRPRVVKGNPFFERAEIKDLMAYFAVLLNPADELRMTRIINVPPRGIGPTTVERVRDIAQRNGIPMFAVVSMPEQFPELARATEKLKRFSALLQELYAMIPTATTEELYDALLEKTGYLAALEEDKSDENKNRIENIRELKSFITSHREQTGDSSLASFLDEASLYTDLQNTDADENTVTLMTVHSAKGLEFPTVFITGMEEGIFPSLQAIGNSEQMEEERRLAYVAITRAKKKLFVTSARQRMVFGQTAPHRVSRFVDEIPSEDIDRPYSDLRPSYFAFEDVPKAPWRPPEKKTVAPPKTVGKMPVLSLEAGDRVKHSAFGEGTVQSMSPMGGDFLVEICLDSGGTKRLMLNAASRFMSKL